MRGDDRQSRAEHYREIAESLGRLARQTRFPDVRQDLIELAANFERMAEHAEKWQSIDR